MDDRNSSFTEIAPLWHLTVYQEFDVQHFWFTVKTAYISEKSQKSELEVKMRKKILSDICHYNSYFKLIKCYGQRKITRKTAFYVKCFPGLNVNFFFAQYSCEFFYKIVVSIFIVRILTWYSISSRFFFLRYILFIVVFLIN